MSTANAAGTLDALFAAPVRVTVAGEVVRVRGVVLDELADFLRLYDRAPGNAGGAEADGEAGTEDPDAVRDWAADLLAMLARLCDRPLDWLQQRADDELEALFAAMRRANAVLFEPQPARHGPRGNRGHSWATAAAWLVECGHSLHQVRGYTLGQIEQLTAAHARLAADRRIDELSIARAAQAPQKGYRAALKSLEKARAQLG